MKTLICIDCGWIGNESQAMKIKDEKICPACRGETDEVLPEHVPSERKANENAGEE